MPAVAERDLDTPLAAGTTIAQARRALADDFASAGLDSPELDARLLVGHALGLDQTGLAVEGGRALADAEAQAIAALAARRLEREPVARIVGARNSGACRCGSPRRRWCRGRRPKPWSRRRWPRSTPADRARARCASPISAPAQARCCSRSCPSCRTRTASAPISAARRLRWRATTPARHGFSARAQFVACDFGAALAGGFDLVVCNPPYVASGEIAALAPEVRHDPRRALDGGADGLACYRAIGGAGAGAARAGRPSGGRAGHRPGASGRATCSGKRDLTPSPARADLAGIPRALHARVCHNAAMSGEHCG